MRLESYSDTDTYYQSPHTHVFRCLIYPTGASSCSRLVAPISVDADESDLYWSEDVDLEKWFPHGHTSEVVTHLPGTSFRLKNALTICYTEDQVSSVVNIAISRLCHRHWLGNLVVLKMGRRYNDVIQVAWGEESFVDLIVGLSVCFGCSRVLN